MPSERVSGSAEAALRRARRLPVPRRAGRRSVRRKGEVAAPARPLVLPAGLVGHAARDPADGGARRRDRDDRDRHRGRGAAPRAEPRQAPPAAVQRPAARRQVVPVHRRHGRGRLPAGDVHARAAPPRRRLLRAVREREEGARDARRPEPRLPLPAVRGAAARPAQRHPVPRLPHRALLRAVRRLHLAGGLPRADRPGDRVPLGRRQADPAAARGADAAGRGRGALRGRRALPQPAARGRAAVRAAGGRAASRSGRSTCSGSRCRPSGRRCRSSRCARGGWSTATRSTSRTPPARSSTRCSRGSASSTTARLASIPPQILVPRGVGDTSALEAFLSERRGSHVEVRAPERGEKRRLQELAQQNAELALQSETFMAETKRSRRVEALEELREVLNLESLPIRIECFDISNTQGREIVGSMVVFQDGVAEEGALPQVHGADASRARTTSPRCTRSCCAASRACRPIRARRSGTSRSPPRRTSSWSTAARASSPPRSPRCASSICRGWPSSRSPSGSRRCSCPGAPSRSCCPGHSPGLQLLQRIRDEAHRFAITFHRQRRDAASRESMFDQIEGVGPARRRALLQHFGSAERVLEATAGGARGRAGRPGQDGAAHLRAAAQGRPGLSRWQAAAAGRAGGGLAGHPLAELRAVLRRQRGLGERDVVPEPRRLDPRLPADALGVPARRARVLPVRAGAAARAVGGVVGRPVRPAQADPRLAARRDRVQRRPGGARLGRPRDGVGRDRLLGRARRDERRSRRRRSRR